MTDFKKGMDHLRHNVSFTETREAFASHLLNTTSYDTRSGRESQFMYWFVGAGNAYLGVEKPKFQAHDAYALRPVQTDVGVLAIRTIPITWPKRETILRETQLIEVRGSVPSNVNDVTTEQVAGGFATVQVLGSVDQNSRVWLPGQESVSEQDLLSFITVSNAVLQARGIPVFEPPQQSA